MLLLSEVNSKDKQNIVGYIINCVAYWTPKCEIANRSTGLNRIGMMSSLHLFVISC